MTVGRRSGGILGLLCLAVMVVACSSPDLSSINPEASDHGSTTCGGAISVASVELALDLEGETEVVSSSENDVEVSPGVVLPERCVLGQELGSRIRFSFFPGQGAAIIRFLRTDVDDNDRIQTFAGTGLVIGGIDEDSACLGAEINHPSLLLIIDFGAADVPRGRDACQDAMTLAVQTFNNLDLPQYDSAPIPDPRMFQWDGVVPPETVDLIDGPFSTEPPSDG